MLVASLVFLAGGTAALWLLGGPSDHPVVPETTANGVTTDRFALVAEGMEPSDVAEILGTPARETTSLAEGFAWPEPDDTCWYYPSADRTREYQVCFVDDTVVTRGSYLVTGKG